MNSRVRNVCRPALILGTVAAVSCAIAVGVAAPAFADPATNLVAVGSDTTQDVMDQIAVDRGNGVVGSWDAVNPVTAVAHEEITPKAGCSMTRPNGSGEGLNALRASINPNTTAPQLADPPEQGCVDFSRSSSAPAAADVSPNGELVYIPFALDAVATATGPATAVTGSDPAVATAITHADDFTLAQISDMYDNCNPQTVDGVTYDPTGATGTPIDLYIPQSGSGTRNFWAQTLGFNATTPPSCVHDHSVLDPSEQVEEHDGTIYSQDANGFGPFSIAQFVAQTNGHHDRRHNVVIHSINGVAPLTSSNTLNTAFPVTREVYNIAQFSAVDNGSGGPGTNALLSALLDGPQSRVCTDGLQIASYGFASLASAPLGHTCGQIASDLRAFDPSSDPV